MNFSVSKQALYALDQDDAERGYLTRLSEIRLSAAGYMRPNITSNGRVHARCVPQKVGTALEKRA